MQSNVLVCGGSGQVGQELVRQIWPVQLQPNFPDRDVLDITDRNAIRRYFSYHGSSLSAVINCAAYTAVDRAEVEVGQAYLANAQGAAWLAEACREHRLPLIHVSTDYVFDGNGVSYATEDDQPAPLGVYGSSKLAGEIAILAANPRSIVLRTAWVVGTFGNNFLKTMLRLGSERPELRIVADQFGCPTGAGDVARALITICDRLASDPNCPTGRFHFVNAGEASWYDLAIEIFRQSSAHGWLAPHVSPIPSSDYSTTARRPTNSRLSTEKIKAEFGIAPRPWREVVAEVVHEVISLETDAAVKEDPTS